MRRGAVLAALAIAFAIGPVASTEAVAKPRAARPAKRGKPAKPDCKKVEKAKRKAGRIAQLLAVAQCHHKAGQYTAAWYEYTEAAARAREKNDNRSLKIAQKGVQQNAGLLAWITVIAEGDTTLEIDGEKTVSGAKKAVDPGKHTVTATGPGRPTPWTKTLDLLSGDVEDVQVPAVEPAAASAQAATEPSASPAEPTPADAAASPLAAPAAAEADRPAESESETAPEAEPHTGVVADLETLIQVYDEVPAGQTAAESGQAFVFVATVGYDFSPSLRAFARYGLVDNYAPGRAHAASLSNPALGASYGITPLRWLRLAAEGGIIVPIGSGGGDDPAAGIAIANVRARALHPTLFDPNYLTTFVSVSATASYQKLVGRFELGLDPSFKTRGGDQNEDVKTRVRIAAHAGYRIIPQVEPFLELRWFRFVSNPAFVEADSALADNLFAGIGVAGHLAPFRAQLAYLRALDAPLSRDDFAIFAVRVGVDF